MSLLKLAQLVQEDRRSRYGEAAAATVRAQVGGYLTPTGPDDRRAPGHPDRGLLSPAPRPRDRNELIWGDYYLFEALQILRGSLSALEV